MRDYTGKTIFIGIDVHKSTYSVTAICDQEVIKRDRLKASPEGLVHYCLKYFKGAQIKSAYEAGFSGFYLHRFLIKHNIENIVVHAASVEVSARDLVKTDKRDSLKLATQLSTNRLRPIFVPSLESEDKRNLTRLREVFVRQKTRTACQLKSLMHYHGLIPFNQSVKVSKRWIETLKDLNVSKNLKYCIECYASTWRIFYEQVKQLDIKIEKELISEVELINIYRSVPGIGKTAASILLNELGDTSQFSNEEKLFSHAGLTPREHSSGEHVRQGHITRQGKPILRKILVQAAWKAIKKDVSLGAIFENISRRAGKKRAIIALARILLGRIRSCIKRKGFYCVVEPLKTTKELLGKAG